MKQNILSAAFLLGGLLFAQFSFAQKSETRSLGSFSSLNLSGGYDLVTLQQGDSESVKVEAQGIDLDKIETEVKDNTLNVRMKKGTYNYSGKIRLVITYRTLNSVRNSGSTDLVTATPIKGDRFEYSVSGSGDFNGEFAVKSLDIRVSGSGDLRLKGTATDQKFAISGSGDIAAGELRGETADVAISGSGDVEINVSGSVHSRVSGSGDVTNRAK